MAMSGADFLPDPLRPSTQRIIDAYNSREWVERGYSSWQEFCEEVFRVPRKPSPSSDRRDVYFIQAGVSGPIKIGVAGNPMLRLAQLQTSSSEHLRLVATIPGTGAKGEKLLHRRFAAHHQRGEWYRPSVELLEYIKEQQS